MECGPNDFIEHKSADGWHRPVFEPATFRNFICRQKISHKDLCGNNLRDLVLCRLIPLDHVTSRKQTGQKLDNFCQDSPHRQHNNSRPFELYFYLSTGTRYRARQKVRGAIYARFSSRFQKSTADQLRECHEWAAKNNVDISDAHIFIDEAISGRKRGRPGLQALLKAIENDEIDVVLTFATNRIFRKMYMALQFVEEYIVERQKRVVFVAQRIDTNDKHVWKALVNAFAMLDEYVIGATVDAIRAGHQGLLLRGRVHNTLAWGYTGVPIAGEFTRLMQPACTIALDESLRSIVVQVFVWFAIDRLKIAEITRRLRAMNAPLPPRTKRWNRTAVRYLLRNRRYIGDWSYGRRESYWSSRKDALLTRLRPEPLREYQAEWLRIVDDRLFNLTQTRFEEFRDRGHGGRRRRNGEGHELVDVLDSLLICPKHDEPLKVTGSHGDYWGCYHCKKTKQAPEDQEVFSYIERSLAAKLVCDKLGELLDQDTDLINRAMTLAREKLANWQPPSADEHMRLEGQKSKITTDIAFLMANIGETEEERKETSVSMNKLRGERRTLEDRIQQLKSAMESQPPVPTEDELRSKVGQMSEVLRIAAASNDADVRRTANQIVRSLVGGKIMMTQQGARERDKGFLRGEFQFDGTAALLSSEPDRSSSNSGELVSIDFRAREKIDIDADNLKAVLDANPSMTLAEAGRSIGLSKSRSTVAIKHWYSSRNLPKPNLKTRGKAIQGERTPKVAEKLAEDAMRLFETGMKRQDIATALGTHRDAVTAALRFWHKVRGLIYVAKKARRNVLRPNPPKGDQSAA